MGWTRDGAGRMEMESELVLYRLVDTVLYNSSYTGRPRSTQHTLKEIVLYNTIITTSRLRRLVLCILHSMFFAKEKNKNTVDNYEVNLADICDVMSRDYIAVFP